MNSDWFPNILKSINELNLAESKSSFRLHPIYRVAVSNDSCKTIPHVFGEHFISRLLKNIRHVIKTDWILFPKFEAHLPSDAVIFIREKKQGLIVVSPSAGMVLKIFKEKAYTQLLDEEITSLKRLGNSSFGPYIPRLLSDGITKESARWMMMEFHSNASMSEEKKDIRFMLEPISILHKNSGTTITLEQWLFHAYERNKNFPGQKQVEKILEEITREAIKHPGYAAVRAQIHHDLHAQNVLVSAKKTPIFIDWEGEIIGLSLIDFLDFERRNLNSTFFNFIRTGKDAPSAIVNTYAFYLESLRTHFGIQLAPETLRLSCLIYAAERALLLFEKRKVNRFSDQNGFESKILEAIK